LNWDVAAPTGGGESKIVDLAIRGLLVTAFTLFFASSILFF